MQHLDIEKGNRATRYGFPHAKGIILGALILVAVGFMKGGKTKKMQQKETMDWNYDLTKFEARIQESKKLLKKNRP